MNLELSSMGFVPPVGSAEDLAVSSASPTLLSIQLGRRERLDTAWLLIRRMDGSGLPTPSLLTETSEGGSMQGIRWLGVGWGESRELQAISLPLTSPRRPKEVRVSVPGRRGRWQALRGPLPFTVDGHRIHVPLHDTVTDQVRVELLDDRDASMTFDLDPAAVPLVELGDEPRELSLSLRGGRRLMRWHGPIPDGGLAIDDLLALLPPECRRPGATLVLELGAEVAGDVELQWSMTSVVAATTAPHASRWSLPNAK